MMEFTDRYQALGMPYPDEATMCKGQCEGIGVYPVREADTDLDDHERAEIARIKAESGESDGAYFIRCGDCGGTGTAKGAEQ